MKTRMAISLIALGTVLFAGCGGASGNDESALPDCRSYRAAISRAFEDPESTVTPTGLSVEDKRAVVNERQSFQAAIAAHAQEIADQQAGAARAKAAVAAGSTSVGDLLMSGKVMDDTAQHRQAQLTRWQTYVDQEIPRILSRQGCP